MIKLEKIFIVSILAIATVMSANATVVTESMLDDYVTIDTNQTITGKKTFPNTTVVTGANTSAGKNSSGATVAAVTSGNLKEAIVALDNKKEEYGNKITTDTGEVLESYAGSTVMYPSMKTTNAMIDNALSTTNENVSGLEENKQPKSTKNYQLGAANGTWVDAGLLATKSEIKNADVANNAQIAPSKIATDASNRFVSDTEKSTWNGKQPLLTTGTNGNIVGSGSVSVSKADGVITISGTDNDTTYSTGTASAAGLTKLYTGTGSGVDGTMTQQAITNALAGKQASGNYVTIDTEQTITGKKTFPNTTVVTGANTSAGKNSSGATVAAVTSGNVKEAIVALDNKKEEYGNKITSDTGEVLESYADSSVMYPSMKTANAMIDQKLSTTNENISDLEEVVVKHTKETAAGSATLPVYIASDGTATPITSYEGNAATATNVAWSGVTGKPSSYTPSSHNQASNTINAMTGYAKADSATAISTSDSLNTAIGKLEKALDGKQDSGSYVPTSRTVNSKALSSNVTLTGADVAVTGYSKPSSTGAIAATDTVNAAIGKLEKALDGKQASGTYVTIDTEQTITGKKTFPNTTVVTGANTAAGKASNGTTTVAAVTGNVKDAVVALDSKKEEYKNKVTIVTGEDLETYADSPAMYPSMKTANAMIDRQLSFALEDYVEKVVEDDATSLMGRDKDGLAGKVTLPENSGLLYESTASGTRSLAVDKATSVASGNTKPVTSGAVYTEVRPSATNTQAQGYGYLQNQAVKTNLTALDTAIKAVHPSTGEVKIPSGGEKATSMASIWVE